MGPNLLLKTFWKCCQDVVKVSQMYRCAQLAIRCPGPDKEQVGCKSAIKQYRISRKIADTAAQTLEPNAPNIHTSNADRSRPYVVDARNEPGQGALAGAILPDDDAFLSCGNPERRNTKSILPPFIAKLNGFEF